MAVCPSRVSSLGTTWRPPLKRSKSWISCPGAQDPVATSTSQTVTTSMATVRLWQQAWLQSGYDNKHGYSQAMTTSMATVRLWQQAWLQSGYDKKTTSMATVRIWQQAWLQSGYDNKHGYSQAMTTSMATGPWNIVSSTRCYSSIWLWRRTSGTGSYCPAHFECKGKEGHWHRTRQIENKEKEGHWHRNRPIENKGKKVIDIELDKLRTKKRKIIDIEIDQLRTKERRSLT